MDEQADRVSRILAGSAANLAPAIVQRFNDSGSEVRYIRRCGVVSLEIPEMGEGSTAHVLIDGFRYVDVEFEWLVIKRGKGKGGRKREKNVCIPG